MPITSTDLILYGAASRPTDDTSTSGGAIDTQNRPDFSRMTASAQLQLVSDGADARTVTVAGRRPDGTSLSEVVTLNGTTAVLTANTFGRLLSATLSATSGTNTVTIQQGAAGPTLMTLPPNTLSRSALFRNSTSEATTADRYEKVFWKNNHATLALLGALVTLTADPDARIMIGLSTAQNDTGSVANRMTAPAGITFVDDNVDVAVPGTDLGAGAAIGVWVRQTLPANDVAHDTTYTLQIRGTTT
jgi:hypothetical protein